MNINFTEKQENYIRSLVESGDYQNASEVVRDALRDHEIRHRIEFEKLREELIRAWDSPISPRRIEDIIADARTQHSTE